MEILKQSRSTALSLLKSFPAKEALALLLLYGARAQLWLDTGEQPEFDAQAALKSAGTLAGEPDWAGFLEFFRGLEILTPRWQQLLCARSHPRLPEGTLRLAGYLVERYWLQAISDFDLMGRVKFVVIACLLVGALPGRFLENAQLFSKEIENDADNVDAILDAAQCHRPFADIRLLGMLLGAQE